MKRTILLLFLLLPAILLYGQDAPKEPKEVTHEVGINFTTFIKQFIDFNSDTDLEISPYVLSYRFISGRNALRTGIGIEYRQSNEDEVPGTSTGRKITDVSVDYRIGYERRFPIKEKFLAYVGVDAHGFADNSKVETISAFGDSITQDYNRGFGAGPLMGVEYRFNSRISLATEANLTARKSYQLEKRVVGGDFPFSEENKGGDFQITYGLPTSLYLNIKF